MRTLFLKTEGNKLTKYVSMMDPINMASNAPQPKPWNILAVIN